MMVRSYAIVSFFSLLLSAAPAGAENLAGPPAPREPSLSNGDDRRTLGRFGSNLGRNFVGVFSRDNLGPFALGAGLAGLSRFGDVSVRSSFQRSGDSFGNLGDRAGQGSTVVPLTAALFLAGQFSRDSKFQAVTYDIAQATLINGVYTYGLKQVVHRTRPDGSNDMSFPSGHTSNAFAWATVANRHYGPRVGVPAYLAAGLIGASRIRKDKHYLSDVVAGATLGYVVGRTVVRGDGGAVHARRWALAPTTGPDGGVGLAFSVDLGRR
jgi:membrane-associated phospholipid phosphatase